MQTRDSQISEFPIKRHGELSAKGRVFMYPIWHIHGPPHKLGQRKLIEAQYLDV